MIIFCPSLTVKKRCYPGVSDPRPVSTNYKYQAKLWSKVANRISVHFLLLEVLDPNFWCKFISTIRSGYSIYGFLCLAV